MSYPRFTNKPDARAEIDRVARAIGVGPDDILKFAAGGADLPQHVRDKISAAKANTPSWVWSVHPNGVVV